MEKSYLRLSGGGFFKIPQIKAKVVIIEIYDINRRPFLVDLVNALEKANK